MRHRVAVLAACLSLLWSGSALATPVIYPAEIEILVDADLALSALGGSLVATDSRIAVGGHNGLQSQSMTILQNNSIVDTVFAERAISVQGDHMAAIGINDEGRPEVQLYQITDSAIDALAALEIPGAQDIDSFGSAVAVSSTYIAVLDPGERGQGDDVLIIEIASKDGEPDLNGTVRVETTSLHSHLEIQGETLIVSSVPPAPGSGSVVLFDLTTGSELARIDNIGGGPIVAGESALFVQRNQFFTQPIGPWSRIAFDGRSLGRVDDVPAVGSALAVSDSLVVVGDSVRNQVLIFEQTEDDRWPFTFSQAYVADAVSSDMFGKSVALIDDLALVGVPGRSSNELGNRGAVDVFEFAEGPVGCTIVGTPGDDEKLTGTSGRDTICGLAGIDRILGFAGDDIIYGGPGDDTLLGNAGADILYGEDGDDILNGSEGDDQLFGGPGDDTGNGGDGDDVFIGGPGRDRGNGGEGVNTCEAEQRFRC